MQLELNKSRIFLKFIFIFMVVLVECQVEMSPSFMPSLRHNKRSNTAAQMTLHVEPHHGMVPTHPEQSSILDYHFLVGSDLFNFTCTIRHPSYKYRLIISREQKLPNGETIETIFTDPIEYKLDSKNKEPRYFVEFSEPKFLDPNSVYIRLSLQIKNLDLKDNGIYICRYGATINRINLVVYKPAVSENVHFPDTALDKVELNTESSLTCRVNDVYPKPTITIEHPKKGSLKDVLVEEEVSNVEDNSTAYHSYSLTTTYKFTPEYSDNNANFTCLVVSTGATSKTVIQSHILKVEGVQIIESNCIKKVQAKVGDKDLRITCQFFANPKTESSYMETKRDQEKAQTNVENSDSSAAGSSNSNENSANSESNNNVVNVENEKSENSETSSSPADEQPPVVSQDALIKLAEGGEDGHYHYVIEDSGEGNSGIYEAVLKISEVTANDFKNYTFKIDKYEAKIRLLSADQYEKDLSLSSQTQSSASALFISHSKTIILLIINLILFFSVSNSL